MMICAYSGQIDELKRIAESTEKELEELELDKIGEWLDRVLEIRRVQSLIDGKWETLYYEFITATGQPNAILDTDGHLIVTWYNDYLEVILSYDAREKLKEIEKYLDEIFFE
jgi:hypothetical protein